MKIPLHSYDLIRVLSENYPEVIYDHACPHDEQLMRFGERRLVIRLLRLVAREQEDELNVRGEHPEEAEE